MSLGVHKSKCPYLASIGETPIKRSQRRKNASFQDLPRPKRKKSRPLPEVSTLFDEDESQAFPTRSTSNTLGFTLLPSLPRPTKRQTQKKNK